MPNKSKKNDLATFRYASAEASPGFMLWKITQLWQAKILKALTPFALTQTQYAILASLKWCVEHQLPTTQAYLIGFSKIEKMTFSVAIRKLVTRGMLTRSVAKSDSRAIEVAFTPAGQKLVNGAIVAVENADEQFFSAISERERKSYLQWATKMIHASVAQSQ